SRWTSTCSATVWRRWATAWSSSPDPLPGSSAPPTTSASTRSGMPSAERRRCTSPASDDGVGRGRACGSAPLPCAKVDPGRRGGMADAEHSKCFVRKGVWVRVPPPALNERCCNPRLRKQVLGYNIAFLVAGGVLVGPGDGLLLGGLVEDALEGCCGVGGVKRPGFVGDS